MRRLLATCIAIAAAAVLAFGGEVARSTPASAQTESRVIAFPVQEDVYYIDTFGACRDGCTRRHKGQDLIGRKMMHLLATTDATVTFMRTDAAGTGGNWLVLTDADGWRYNYGHINNDTPGTDDGKNEMRYMYAPGLKVGSKVKKGQFVAYMGDSGNAENSGPHVHFEIRKPDDDETPINPWASLRFAQGKTANGLCGPNTAPTPAPVDGTVPGYWTVTTNGVVQAFGNAQHVGDRAGSVSAPVVGLAGTPSRAGYWLAGRDGRVYTFGDARRLGDARDMQLGVDVVGIAATADGRGYWLATEDGGVISFGRARVLGSLANRALSSPVTGITASPSGLGFWLVTADGAVHPFGDAPAYGDARARSLVSPIIGLVRTASGGGYWLLSRRGGLLAYGDATDHGSIPALGLCDPQPAAGLVPSASGAGYVIAQGDGTVVGFGDARSLGNAAGTIADIVAAP